MSVLPAIANRLREHVVAGLRLPSLGERRHLEPFTVTELERVFPLRAEKDRKVAIPAWPDVGRVDAIVRASPGSQRLDHLIELKWCPGRRGTLYEGIWDLFKMALGSTRPDVRGAYLIGGAPSAAWETDLCRDLFDSTFHSPVELCKRRFPSGSRRLAWDDLLEGGYDRFPSWVPGEIETHAAGSEAIADEDERWELRAVRVTSDSAALVPFERGWPFGARPEDALHPALP